MRGKSGLFLRNILKSKNSQEGNFYEEDSKYIYLLGHRVRFEKSTNIFQLIDLNGKVYYQIYPSEYAQMLEIAAKQKQIDLVMVFRDKEGNGNHGTLQLMPKMKWIGE